MSSAVFFERFATPNLPVVLLDVVQAWDAFRVWRAPGGIPDYRHLADFFGDTDVPVTDCGALSGAAYGAGQGLRMCAREFFELAAAREVTPGGGNDSLLYLKDWHMQRSFQGLYDAPDFLAAPLHDWLNLHMDTAGADSRIPGEDDFRFCYAGVAGTSTPLHHDVLLSYSWSANICGEKRWVLFPPEVTPLLTDTRGESPASAVPGRRPYDWEKHYPRLDEAWAQRIEFVQEGGELVFVPSGWYHEVENLTDAISVNHNWFNAASLNRVWEFVAGEHSAVRAAIADLKETFESPEEWEQKCEELMRANCGINLAAWMELLATASREIERCLRAGSAALTAQHRVALLSVPPLCTVADATLAVLATTALPVPVAAERLRRAQEFLQAAAASAAAAAAAAAEAADESHE